MGFAGFFSFFRSFCLVSPGFGMGFDGFLNWLPRIVRHTSTV